MSRGNMLGRHVEGKGMILESVNLLLEVMIALLVLLVVALIYKTLRHP